MIAKASDREARLGRRVWARTRKRRLSVSGKGAASVGVPVERDRVGG